MANILYVDCIVSVGLFEAEFYVTVAGFGRVCGS